MSIYEQIEIIYSALILCESSENIESDVFKNTYENYAEFLKDLRTNKIDDNIVLDALNLLKKHKYNLKQNNPSLMFDALETMFITFGS